jgi:hypothetical protein
MKLSFGRNCRAEYGWRSVMKAFTFPIMGLIFLSLSAGVCGGQETIRLPLTVDYPFIRSELIYQLYTQPGERAAPFEGECTTVELSDPEVSPENSLVKIVTQIKIMVGLPLWGKCRRLMTWEGYIEVLQRVWLDEKDWRIRFRAEDSRVYDRYHKPARIAQFIWNRVKTGLYQYLDELSIDLNPPLEELRRFLPLIFSSGQRKWIEDRLMTIRPSPLRVETSAVKLDIVMDMGQLIHPQEGVQNLPSLPPVPLEHLVAIWQNLDAYWVYQIETLLGRPLTEKESDIFLSTLLAGRYTFVRALTDETLDQRFIREQLILSWQSLTPILRKYLFARPSRSLLSYLAFFTAGDALAVLDRVGPYVGIEISREGLVRLAFLLVGGESKPSLEYGYAVDPDLRRFFGLGPPLDDSGPSLDSDEVDLSSQPEENDPSQSLLWLKYIFPLIPDAQAATPEIEEIRHWLVPREDIMPYLNRVRGVLEEAAAKTVADQNYTEEHRSLYELLVLATAWQESCWRQFVLKGKKISFLLSYNKSSVGLMQINQRVWRGIYRVQSLRWNIRYNARAGSEILDLYWRKYIRDRMDSLHPPGTDTQAQLAYALYNAGPEEFEKFLKRKMNNSLLRSDQLFKEKYDLAKDGHFEKVSTCLLGE